MNKKYVIMTQDDFENPEWKLAWFGQWDERDTSYRYDSKVFLSKQDAINFLIESGKQKLRE